MAARSSNGGGGTALRSGMTVGRLTLSEERSRTVKASERVALDQALPPDTPTYRDVTTGFHHAVYQAAAHPVLSLLTQAVTHIVTQHVVMTMDPVELRGPIVDEQAEPTSSPAATPTPPRR